MIAYTPRVLKSPLAVASIHSTPTVNEYKAMITLNFTCQCCGFTAVPTKKVPSAGLEFIDIHGQLKLLCVMCAQSQCLSRPVANLHGSNVLNHGRLVFCPEFTQGQLNNVIRDIYVATEYQRNEPNRALRSHIDEIRRELFDKLFDRCSHIPALKVNNDDLIGFTNLYQFAGPDIISKEAELFSGLRYVPHDAPIIQYIQFWLHTSYSGAIDSVGL